MPSANFWMVACGPTHLKKTSPSGASTIAPESAQPGFLPCDCIAGPEGEV